MTIKGKNWRGPRPPPLHIVERRGKLLFVRRRDGRGYASEQPPPLPGEVEWIRHVAKLRRLWNLAFDRLKGSGTVKAKAAERERAIKNYAIEVGWPRRGVGKLVKLHFDPVRGNAPKHLRCSPRTVAAALARLRK